MGKTLNDTIVTKASQSSLDTLSNTVAAVSASKLSGTTSNIMGSGFKLLTTAKTLERGVHLIPMTNGVDLNELPGVSQIQYGYALIIVRTVNDMISVVLFCGTSASTEGIWLNSSNGGNFFGWKRVTMS